MAVLWRGGGVRRKQELIAQGTINLEVTSQKHPVLAIIYKAFHLPSSGDGQLTEHLQPMHRSVCLPHPVHCWYNVSSSKSILE